MVEVSNLSVVVVNKMIVFLRRIPADTKKQEIIAYIKPFLKGRLLQKSGRIEGVKILVLKETQTNTIEYHGLVTIDSDDVARRVIKKTQQEGF